LQRCYQALKADVFKKFQVVLTNPKAIGISGMMHGYLVLDKNDKLLTPFRTWRNTSTKQAVDYLSPYLNFNIPQR
jgi:sugar (pentulose or hexulose) kinase